MVPSQALETDSPFGAGKMPVSDMGEGRTIKADLTSDIARSVPLELRVTETRTVCNPPPATSGMPVQQALWPSSRRRLSQASR